MDAQILNTPPAQTHLSVECPPLREERLNLSKFVAKIDGSMIDQVKTTRNMKAKSSRGEE